MILSIAALILYVHHIGQSLRVAALIESVGTEVGATLYALLAGRPPRAPAWPPGSMEELMAALRAPVPPVAGVSAALHAVLVGALEAERDDLPDDAVGLPLDQLAARSEVGRVCSQEVMLARTLEGADATGWRREVLPQQLRGQDDWLFHCVAGAAEGGELTDAAFRSG